MVIREFYAKRSDGVNLYLTKSTETLKIRKVGTGEIYDEAVDVEFVNYVYEETDIPIEVVE